MWFRAPARTPACCACRAAGRSRSRSSLTTIPRPSNRIRAPQRARVAFCATSLRRGGEVDFAPGYSGNPLVNAMCVGVLKEKDLIKAAAHGVGNVLLAVGSSTGRDGIHGASFASEELTRESEQRRPQVQVGDPFTEKLLLEASLELIASGHIVAIQDMGAAGLTSSSAEMAARGGVGVEIDLSKVPTRGSDMSPYEILLSESQERMLVVAKADRVAQVQAITAKWDLEARPLGKVTDDGMYRCLWKGKVVVEIPGQRLLGASAAYFFDP